MIVYHLSFNKITQWPAKSNLPNSLKISHYQIIARKKVADRLCPFCNWYYNLKGACCQNIGITKVRYKFYYLSIHLTLEISKHHFFSETVCALKHIKHVERANWISKQEYKANVFSREPKNKINKTHRQFERWMRKDSWCSFAFTPQKTTHWGISTKMFYLLLYSQAHRTVLHSPLEKCLWCQWMSV